MPRVVAPVPFLLEPAAQPRVLRGRGGDGELAPLDQAGVDAFGGTDPGHLVHRVAEVLFEVTDAVPAPWALGVAGA